MVKTVAFAQATGTPGDDVLIGTPGDDILDGGAGNDILIGNGGADRMYGGGGDDQYLVDSPDDQVFEYADEGWDTIHLRSSYVLAAGVHVEVMQVEQRVSTFAINLTGNELNNILLGNDGVNVIVGGGGRDVMMGYGGDDHYLVDSADDVVYEFAGEGWDTIHLRSSYTLAAGVHVEVMQVEQRVTTNAINLTGNELDNILLGNDGVNLIVGGGGRDVMMGYGGDDHYLVDSADDVVYEFAGEGWDTIHLRSSYALAAGVHVEVMQVEQRITTNAINLTGNELDNILLGNDGANVIVGGGGRDVMMGYGGDDHYLVDSADDVVYEFAGEGWDTIHLRSSYTLAAGVHVEVMQVEQRVTTNAINLTGNELDNVLRGNDGVNIIVGGGGRDTMIGYGGNDHYLVDSPDDVVYEFAGEGWDTIHLRSSYTLAAGVHVEEMLVEIRATTNAIDLTGNELDNVLHGNNGANVIDGGGGTDRLYGYGGSDTFAFTTALGVQNIDVIGDFNVAEDRILLGGASGQPFFTLATGALDAASFRIGSVALDADDYIIYNATTGALLYDADGAGGAAAVQFAILAPGLNLTAAHFVVSGLPNSVPTVTSGGTVTVEENIPTDTVIYQVQGHDADGDRLTYFIAGPDAVHFRIDSTGAVRFVSSPDYETRSSYTLTVGVSDSGTVDATRQVTITIGDVAEGAAPYIVTEQPSNDTLGTAQPLNRELFTVTNSPNLPNPSLPSATINGSISAPSDKDFFTITLKEGELLILDVDGTNGLDSLLRLFGPDGAELVMNDDHVTFDPGSNQVISHNWDSYISFRAPTSGTYTFSIEAFSNAQNPAATSGVYSLNVSIGPPATEAELIEENIQALLSGARWNTLDLTYGFTTSAAQYGPGEGVNEKGNAFEALNATQQAVVRQLLSHISTVTNLGFTELVANPGSAQLRYAMSDDPGTAHAYYPGSGNGGDSWYNNSKGTYDNPKVGNYAYLTFLHETGHALGLKHGHEAPALSHDRNSLEFSVMTYNSFVGDDAAGYGNEMWGFPQTLMMYDIAALQRLYGADFGHNAGDTIYSWHPSTGAFMVNGVTQWTPGGNRVFMTVWDGGGNDTYDLSNYSNSVTIDLRPGEWTTTSQIQLANLGTSVAGQPPHYARGNVANSLLYNGDVRSLIENAIGGTGSDILIANQTVNRLTGGAGADTFRWMSLNDSRAGAADFVMDFMSGQDRIDLSFVDAISGTEANEAFAYIGSNAFTGIAGQLRAETIGGQTHILGDVNGDGVADFQIILANVTTPPPASDFIL